MEYGQLFRLYKAFLNAEPGYSRDVLKVELEKFSDSHKDAVIDIPIELHNYFIEILQLYGELYKINPEVDKSDLEEQLYLKLQAFKKVIPSNFDISVVESLYEIENELSAAKREMSVALS